MKNLLYYCFTQEVLLRILSLKWYTMKMKFLFIPVLSSLHLSLSQCFSLCVFLSICNSFALRVSLSCSPYISLLQSLSLSLSHYFHPFLFHFLSLSLPLSLTHSLTPFSAYFHILVLIHPSACLSMSQYLSFPCFLSTHSSFSLSLSRSTYYSLPCLFVSHITLSLSLSPTFNSLSLSVCIFLNDSIFLSSLVFLALSLSVCPFLSHSLSVSLKISAIGENKAQCIFFQFCLQLTYLVINIKVSSHCEDTFFSQLPITSE